MSEIPQGALAPVPVVQEPATPELKKPEGVADKERIEHLARKERALRQQQRDLQYKQKAFEEQQQAWKKQQEPKPVPIDWHQKITEDPMGVIKGLAATNEELKQQLAELKGEIPQVLDKVQAGQKQAYEQAVKQLTRDVRLLVDSDDQFETIKATKSEEAVVELIKTTYNEDGILLTAQEAAKQIEEYLLNDAVSLAKLKKVQSKLAPPVAEASQAKKIQVSQQPQISTRTLTNAITQQSTNSKGPSARDRAIAAFKNQLK